MPNIPVLIRRCKSGVTACAVTSTHITIILESLPKPGDDTLGNFKFLDTSSWVRPHIPVVQYNLPRKKSSKCFLCAITMRLLP
ncbi:hypothetical protein TNCV_5025731 [Trichonephila clavipes]|nr:hypothetical protein TNCV_5025731 [Trichonephila clavipes]